MFNSQQSITLSQSTVIKINYFQATVKTHLGTNNCYFGDKFMMFKNDSLSFYSKLHVRACMCVCVRVCTHAFIVTSQLINSTHTHTCTHTHNHSAEHLNLITVKWTFKKLYSRTVTQVYMMINANVS
jgi:hypothetical protein